MNSIEQLVATVVKAIPGVEHELFVPRNPQGRWTLDLAHDGWSVVAMWISGKGFGLTAGSLEDEHGYGENPDRHYDEDDVEAMAAEVVGLLTDKERTARPRGVVLRELRAQLGLSQVELAECLGVQQSAVSKIERREDMSVSTLIRVIESMGGELEFWVRFPNDAPVKLSHFASSRASRLVAPPDHAVSG